MKIIFILHNIFESKSGVSNKYIKFIDYIISININYLIFTPSFNNLDLNYNIYQKKFINIPFYNDIKIPIINLNDLINIINFDDLIIFNGEFFWLYDILSLLKKQFPLIKIIPNWHTNYEFYSSIYFNNNFFINNIKNNLFNNLNSNFFNGIIVTGDINTQIFKKYSSNVFNANEICFNNFDIFKINNYNFKKIINFIYTGRISIEKNLSLIIDISNYLLKSNIDNFLFHIIGNGPYFSKFKSLIDNNLFNNFIFYGDTDYNQIKNIYNSLDNRIFIQTSKSETFGKSTMEAAYSGIPIFIIKCDIHEILFNDNNSFIFDNVQEFKNQLILFFNLNYKQIEFIINNNFINAKKYDQNIIFKNLYNFISNLPSNNNYNYKNSLINNLFYKINNTFDYFK